MGQVDLLNGTQSFGRGCIASQNDKVSTHGEKLVDSLKRKPIYDVERPGAIGRASIVTQIDIVVVWKPLTDGAENGQSAIAGIKKSDH